MGFLEDLKGLGACHEGTDWMESSGNVSASSAWSNAPRLDWLIWWAHSLSHHPGYKPRRFVLQLVLRLLKLHFSREGGPEMPADLKAIAEGVVAGAVAPPNATRRAVAALREWTSSRTGADEQYATHLTVCCAPLTGRESGARFSSAVETLPLAFLEDPAALARVRSDLQPDFALADSPTLR